MSISAEWVINKSKNRIYAVSHAQVIVRNRSTVDKDLTSLENRATESEDNITIVKQRLSNLMGGSALVMLGKTESAGEITIPTEGWTVDDLGGYHLDIENEAIDESIIPIIAVAPESYDAAIVCGLKPYCKTFDGNDKGILRLYADSIPTLSITVSMALIGGGTAVTLESLPKASRLSAGVVQPSRGFIVNSDTGELNVDNNVIVTDDDLVDETQTIDDIRDSLKD